MQGRYWLSFLSTEMEMTDYHHDADPVGDSSIYTMESVISNDFRVGHASLVVMFEPVETDNWKVAIGGGFVVPAGAKLVSGNRSGYSISCADTGVWNCDTTDLSYHGRTGPANFGSFGPAFSVQLERTLAVGSVYLSIDAWTGLAVNSWLNLNEWTVEYRTRGAKVSLGYIFRPKPKDREFLLPIEEEEDDESEEETKDEEEE